MTPTRTSITIKSGEVVELLLTPALYGVGKRKGINLAEKLSNIQEADDTVRAYALMAYCAAINMWEVKQMDNPSLGVFPYSFIDFETWAWVNQDELTRIANLFLEAFTGKGIEQYKKEAKSEPLKKKMKKLSLITEP